jgi:hypothetical protein
LSRPLNRGDFVLRSETDPLIIPAVSTRDRVSDRRPLNGRAPWSLIDLLLHGLLFDVPRVVRTTSQFASILQVKMKKPVMRRRMSIVGRKTILSYYSSEEAQEVIKAAKQQGVSISNFVATAALQQAAIVNSNPKKQS